VTLLRNGWLACAIAAGARFVVADEPTAELDTTSAQGVLRTIRALAETGVTEQHWSVRKVAGKP